MNIEQKLEQKTEKLNKRTKEGLKETMAAAKVNKNDEFYTRYDDIMTELSFYGEQGLLKGKRIILPCDIEYKNPRKLNKEIKSFIDHGLDTTDLEQELEQLKINNMKANFHRVLTTMKDEWGIESITTSYWDGTLTDEENIKLGNTKFQDVDYSKYDIVMTNPPFSLFREFIATMEENNMKYLIVGNNNAISYKETFRLIKDKKLWLGRMGMVQKFNMIYPKNHQKYENPKGRVISEEENYKIVEEQVGVGCWFTNLGTSHDRPEFPLTELYEGNEGKYPKYDNYDAINVNKGKDIPMDYYGSMGVPITFLHKLNTDQFEILGIMKNWDVGEPFINGKALYVRLLIRRVK